MGESATAPRWRGSRAAAMPNERPYKATQARKEAMSQRPIDEPRRIRPRAPAPKAPTRIIVAGQARKITNAPASSRAPTVAEAFVSEAI